MPLFILKNTSLIELLLTFENLSFKNLRHVQITHLRFQKKKKYTAAEYCFGGSFGDGNDRMKNVVGGQHFCIRV
jgi:hypothetical protein